MLQQYARDFNCLSDQDRKTRQRALQKLSALASSPQSELDEAWEQALRVPLLKLFSDTVEKNRELAIGLATQLVPVLGPGMLRDSEVIHFIDNQSALGALSPLVLPARPPTEEN